MATSPSSSRLVAIYDDPSTARAAVDQLAETSVVRDEITIQAGDDRALADGLRSRETPTPTHPAEGGSRVPLTLGVTAVGAAVGAIVGALVALPFEVDVLPRWGEIGIFAVIGAIAAGVYFFVMSGGSGPHPGRETDEDAPQIITLSVPVEPGNEDELRRALGASGAVRVESARTMSPDGGAHH
jgi:hypothetical protein